MKFKNPLLVSAIGLSFLFAPMSALAQQSTSSTRRFSGTLTSTDPQLQNGKRYDSSTFRGRAGQRVSFTLASNSFDPYLVLWDRAGNVIRSNDDINSNTRNAGFTYTLPYTGEYTIVATSYSSSERGSYQLTASGLDSSSSSRSTTASSNAGLAEAAVIVGGGLAIMCWLTNCIGGESSAEPAREPETLCPYTKPEGGRGWYQC